MQKKVFNSSVLILSQEASGIKALALEHSIFKQRIVFTDSFSHDADYISLLQERMNHEDFLPLEVIYCPAADKILQQSFSLPTIAAENLEDVIGIELYKHFPLPAGELSSGWDSLGNEPLTKNEEDTPVTDAQDSPSETTNSFFLVSACATRQAELAQHLHPLEPTALNPDFVCPLPMLLGRSLVDREAALILIPEDENTTSICLYKENILVEGSVVNHTPDTKNDSILTEARKLTARHRILLGVGGVGRIYLQGVRSEQSKLRDSLAGGFGVTPADLRELTGPLPQELNVSEEFLHLLLVCQNKRPESLNLWVKDDNKLRFKRSTKIIAGLCVLLFALLFSLVGYGYLAKWLRISALEAELTELAPQISEVSKLQAQNGARRLLIKRTRELAGDNFSALRFLQKVSDLIPDHTFLVRIAVNKDKKEIHMSGYSMDIEDLEQLLSGADFIDPTKLHPPKINNKFFEYFVFEWELPLNASTFEKLKAEGALTATPPSSMLPSDHLIGNGKNQNRRIRNERTDNEVPSPPESTLISQENFPKTLPAQATPNASVQSQENPPTDANAAQNDLEKDQQQQENESTITESDQEGMDKEEVNELFREIISKMFEDYIKNPQNFSAGPVKSPTSLNTDETDKTSDNNDSGNAQDKSQQKTEPDDNLGWPVSE